MTKREFLQWFVVGIMLLAVPAILHLLPEASSSFWN